MKYLFCIALLVASYSNYAQMSINDRIENQLELKTYNREGVERLIAITQEINPKENILDYKSYIGFIFTNFKSKNNKEWEVIEDLSKKETVFKAYRERLKNDTLFVNTLQRISDNSIKVIENKPEYGFEKVMDIA